MKPINSNQSFKMLISIVCSIMMVFAFIGCEHDAYDPSKSKNDKEPNSFDFSTTSTIQVDVKYDVPKGYKVLFEVYDVYPFITDEEGQIVKCTDLEPIIRRMTDENGAYSGKETIDADHNNEVYVYTSYIGVPSLFKTTINGNAISANINWDTANAPQTRALSGITQAPEGYHTLGGWDATGYPDYLDESNGITIPAEALAAINKALPERGTCPSELIQAVDFKIDNSKGSGAEVSIRMIGGTSQAASIFGYYCYRDGASTEEIKKAPKCIVFPSTLMTDTNEKRASGLRGGESVQLHYIDSAGKDQGTEFPNGIRIGFFLMNDAFYFDNKGSFYSTKELNSDGEVHTARLRIDDFVVLSFEDWTKDKDYNDIQFNVWSNPIEAIITPDIPSVNPDDKEEINYSKGYKGIVAFEDNWPYKRDYDLNDVIVKYNSTLNFNDKNEVISTEDTYELLWSGATYKNGFAYQLNTNHSNVSTEMSVAPTTFPGQGLDGELSQATINVLLSAIDVTGNNTKTETYKVINTFHTPINHVEFGIPPYNPFIMVHNGLDRSRTEVHLVNYPPTDKADMTLFNTGDDLSNPTNNNYYVASGNYPFAIHLSNAENFSTPEAHSIDTSFEHFMDWVNSDGEEHRDWYK